MIPTRLYLNKVRKSLLHKAIMLCCRREEQQHKLREQSCKFFCSLCRYVCECMLYNNTIAVMITTRMREYAKQKKLRLVKDARLNEQNPCSIISMKIVFHFHKMHLTYPSYFNYYIILLHCWLYNH